SLPGWGCGLQSWRSAWLALVQFLESPAWSSAPERAPAPNWAVVPGQRWRERQAQGLVTPQTSTQVQRLDLRERSTLGLRARSGALGHHHRSAAYRVPTLGSAVAIGVLGHDPAAQTQDVPDEVYAPAAGALPKTSTAPSPGRSP